MVLQYIFRKKVLSAEHFKKHLWLKMLVQYYKTIAELEKKGILLLIFIKITVFTYVS